GRPVVYSAGSVPSRADPVSPHDALPIWTSPVVANGVATSTVTITLKDIFLNPVSGVTPTFSATDTGSTNVYGACAATNASGVSTSTLPSTEAQVQSHVIATPVVHSDGMV